jgi:homoserine O-acetyltransferase
MSLRPLRRRLLAAACVAACVAALPGHAAAQGDTGTYVIRDFHFGDGETLPELRLHYLTMGRPVRGRDGRVRNAVLILHGTTGSGRQFLNPLFASELFGAGQPLDTAAHFLIMPDGIGHGRSSRPSDGLHARFPHYDYDDMVEAQYRLLTEHLGVDHLLLVMGTSMGGMHTWVWGERHPAFMDGLVPLASLPVQIAGRNRMMRRLILDDIRGDPAWRGGDYTGQPPGLKAALELLWVMTTSPRVLRRIAPTRDSADAYITGWLARALGSYDANDVWYAFDASRNYDPSPALERITVPLLAINSADDYVNPPELGIMEREIRRVRNGQYVLVPIGPLTRGHGTHTVAAAWKRYFAPFVTGLERRAASR